MTVVADAFDELQRRLGPALHANRPGSGIDHVLVTLPSFSVSESILSHYGDRIASLEHRYLTAVLIVGRITDCHTVIVLSRLPDPAIIEYYLQLVPADERASARSRTTLIEVHDGTTRSVAAKLLDRPDLLDQIRATVGDRPALIEPWNVTENEVALALALGVPINGSNPRVRGLGFKSEGRRLIRRAGVPVPFGVEDVRSADDVVAAVRTIREERPNAPGVVVKHDDSGAGDGNVVIDLGPMDAAADPEAWLREQFEALPDWYRADLERGGIVEERIAGDRVHESERSGRHPARRPRRRPRHARAGARWRVGPGVPGLPLPGRSGVCARAGTPRGGDRREPRGGRGAWTVLRRLRRSSRSRGRGLACLRARDQPAERRNDPPVRGAAQRRAWPLRPGGGPLDHRGRRDPLLQRDGQPRRPGLAGSIAGRRHRGRGRRRTPVRPANRAPASCSTCCPASRSTAGSG